MGRKRRNEEQIVRILEEARRPGAVIEEICRRQGVSTGTLYRWRRKFGDLEVSDVRKMRQLETENGRLKRIVAEQAVDIQVLKEALGKEW